MTTYEIVTEQIIKKLDEGVIPWHKPWRSEETAFNLISGKPYSFLNQLLLPAPGAYLSFNQIKEMGARIREGERASRVVFFKLIDKRTGKGAEEEEASEEKFPLLRYYNIWHVSQLEGLDTSKIPAAPLNNDVEADDDCEDVLVNYIARTGIGFKPALGAKPSYDKHTDTVHTPILTQFASSQGYYATVFHELIHSTGASSRLNRKIDEPVGSRDYSREELVAEIGSAMLCSHLHIDSPSLLEEQASYIAYWKRKLADDPTLIVTASGRAEKAARYILGASAA